MKVEDRRYPRIPATLSVTMMAGEQPIQMLTSDVSLNGAFLRTDDPKPLRQLLQLHFALPNDQAIEVMAMVTRIITREESETQCGMGVGFFALSEDAKNTWNAFLRSLENPEEPDSESSENPSEDAPIRRKHVRHMACFVVRLKDEQRARQFYTENISQGGMFFKTPLLKKEGSSIELVLVHPKTGEEYRLPSTVVRVENSSKASERGMGVQFSPLSVEQDVALEQFISTGINYHDPQKQEDDDLAALRRAIELDPHSPHPHTALAKALIEREQFEEALSSLQRAVELSDTYLPALLQLKDLLLQMDKESEAVRIQALLDGAMKHFARSIAKNPSSDLLDEAPIVPPDLTLTNSLIYEVLEHKYSRSLDGSKPPPLLPPVLTTNNEQPSVLSLIQLQKSSQSVDLLPAFKPPPLLDQQGTMEEVPSIRLTHASRQTGDFHPHALHDFNNRDIEALNQSAPPARATPNGEDDAILLTQKKHTPSPAEIPTQENQSFRAPAPKQPDSQEQPSDNHTLSTSMQPIGEGNRAQDLSRDFIALIRSWSQLERDLQDLGKGGHADEAQQEAMASVQREMQLLHDGVKRLHSRTRQTLRRLKKRE